MIIEGIIAFDLQAKFVAVVHHKFLTALIGYCDDGENMALIYEYMANGDLQNIYQVLFKVNLLHLISFLIVLQFRGLHNVLIIVSTFARTKRYWWKVKASNSVGVLIIYIKTLNSEWMTVIYSKPFKSNQMKKFIIFFFSF